MALVDVAELKKEAAITETITVKGKDYQYKPVSPLLIVDDAAEMWRLAREDHEKVGERLRDLAKNPSYDRLCRVLIKGMVHPRVVASPAFEDQGSACVDVLLIKLKVAVELYIAITKKSFELED